MANFLLIIDPDAERRRRFLASAEPEIAPLQGLRGGRSELGDFAAVWAVSQTAPLSLSVTQDAVTVVFGYAIHDGRALDAAHVASLWTPGAPPASAPAFDGYYAAATYRRGAGLITGSDLLGLFPIYYATAGDVLVVASSPELFRRHPSFPPALDVDGLIGILLTHSAFGACLLRGVTRLQPAHALVKPLRGPVVELRQYEIAHERRHTGLSFSAQVGLLGDAIDAAVRRHASAGALEGVLLSGGRDSRMFTGYLHAQGYRLRTLTMGREDDYETRAARRVAATLGWPHDVADPDAGGAPAFARLLARWEHLATGFALPHFWGMITAVTSLGPRCVMGHMADWIVGGASLRAESGADVARPFDDFFRLHNRRGCAPALLRQLLRQGTRERVDAVMDRLRTAYETGSPIAAQRQWRFILANGGRLYVGGIPWRLSFGTWPVLPVLDRALLDLVGSLPTETLMHRRAQDALLRERFPALSCLPLVGSNADFVAPILATRTARLGHRVLASFPAIRGAVRWTRGERRTTYRVYDFNGPGWSAIRAAAEPHRDTLANLCDMDALRRYVPPPETRVRFADSFFGPLGPKLLIGLMLWREEHPA